MVKSWGERNPKSLYRIAKIWGARKPKSLYRIAKIWGARKPKSLNRMAKIWGARKPKSLYRIAKIGFRVQMTGILIFIFTSDIIMLSYAIQFHQQNNMKILP
jgi:hypothetical protein